MFKDRDRLAFTGVTEEATFGVDFNELNGGFLVLELCEELGISDLLMLGLTGGLTFEGRLESGVIAMLPEKRNTYKLTDFLIVTIFLPFVAIDDLLIFGTLSDN